MTDQNGPAEGPTRTGTGEQEDPWQTGPQDKGPGDGTAWAWACPTCNEEECYCARLAYDAELPQDPTGIDCWERWESPGE